MSAANVFARPSGAYLLADTGRYDHAGRIAALRSKVALSERLRFTITMVGRAAADAEETLQYWLDAQPDQMAAIDGMPHILRLLLSHDSEAVLNGALEIAGAIPEGLCLFGAYWDLIADRARAFAVSNREDLVPNWPLFAIRPVSEAFSPSCGEHWAPGTFNPRVDARKLANVQRSLVDNMGVCRVAGSFEMFRAHRAGIDRAIVCEWPDKIGEKIAVRGIECR